MFTLGRSEGGGVVAVKVWSVMKYPDPSISIISQ